MKKILLAISLLSTINVYAQSPGEPCCSIVGLHPGTNSVTARVNVTGRLFMFRVDPADLKSYKLNDAVSTNESFTYVTGINKVEKKYFAGPVNLLQPASPDAAGLVQLNYEEPCCNIIKIASAEPCCGIITAQNKTSGETFSFEVPAELSKTVKISDPVYTQQINSRDQLAVLQSSFQTSGTEMNVFAFPVKSNESVSGGMLTSDKWVVVPVNEIQGSLGRLNTSFPEGVEWGIDVFSNPAHKFLVNRNLKAKGNYYELAPGNYDFRLNMVMVETVPIEKGKETRLKAGILEIGSQPMWTLWDEAGKKIYSSSGPKKLALPVGNYKVDITGRKESIQIKDGETVNL